MLPACPPLIYFYLKPFYLIWQYTLENICQCGLYCPGRILLSQKSSKSLQTQARGIFPRMFICNVTAVFSTAVHATFTGIWVSFQHGEHCSGNTDAGPSISTHHWYAHIATAVAAVSFWKGFESWVTIPLSHSLSLSKSGMLLRSKLIKNAGDMDMEAACWFRFWVPPTPATPTRWRSSNVTFVN